jgi:hypothetical protein
MVDFGCDNSYTHDADFEKSGMWGSGFFGRYLCEYCS